LAHSSVLTHSFASRGEAGQDFSRAALACAARVLSITDEVIE
jgi:hypothetical protein